MLASFQVFIRDGISQYGCDSPHHSHGTRANTTQERSQCHAFEMSRQMIRIAHPVSRRCPGVIVDFDVTEKAVDFLDFDECQFTPFT